MALCRCLIHPTANDISSSSFSRGSSAPKVYHFALATMMRIFVSSFFSFFFLWKHDYSAPPRHGYRFASCSSGKGPTHLLSFFSSSFFFNSFIISQSTKRRPSCWLSERVCRWYVVDISVTCDTQNGAATNGLDINAALLATAPHRSTIEIYL